MKILRLTELVTKTGLSRSTILRLEEQGRFPQRILLSERTVGWDEKAIDQWLEQKAEASSQSDGKEAGHEHV